MCVRGAASTNSTTRTGWWLLARLLKDRACMIRLSAVFFIYLSLHSVAKFERAEVNGGGKKDFEGYSILFLTRWCILSINANPCEKKIKRFLAKNFNHSFKEYTTGFFFFLSLLINFRLFGNPVAETWSGFFAIRIDWFFFLPWKGKGTCSVHFFGTFNRWVVSVCGRPLDLPEKRKRKISRRKESNNRKNPNLPIVVVNLFLLPINIHHYLAYITERCLA